MARPTIPPKKPHHETPHQELVRRLEKLQHDVDFLNLTDKGQNLALVGLMSKLDKIEAAVAEIKALLTAERQLDYITAQFVLPTPPERNFTFSQARVSSNATPQ